MKFHSIAAICALALASSGVAQVTIQDSEPGIPAQAFPPAVSTQQTHLTALEDMTASSNSTLAKSLAREKRMRAYIENNGMGQAFDAYPTTRTHPMAMTYGEALHQAIVNVQPGNASSEGGSGDVAGEIEAYDKLSRSSWDRLQASMTAVHRMSDFLNSKSHLHGYMNWAGAQATAAHKKMLANGEAAARVARAHTAQVQKLVQSRHEAWRVNMQRMRSERLKWNWDTYKFNTKHGQNKTQLRELNNPYSGFRNYSDGYQDGGGWGLSSTGHLHMMGQRDMS